MPVSRPSLTQAGAQTGKVIVFFAAGVDFVCTHTHKQTCYAYLLCVLTFYIFRKQECCMHFGPTLIILKRTMKTKGLDAAHYLSVLTWPSMGNKTLTALLNPRWCWRLPGPRHHPENAQRRSSFLLMHSYV